MYLQLGHEDLTREVIKQLGRLGSGIRPRGEASIVHDRMAGGDEQHDADRT